MKNGAAKSSWIDSNQAALVAEFERLKVLLGGAGAEQDSRLSDRARLEPPAAIERVTHLFGLSGFERDVLVLCAGVEMDSKLAELCATALGHPPRRFATFGLAMAVLPQAHWSALAVSRPLRRFRMIEIENGAGLTSAALRIDERVLHYLAGVNELDPRLQNFLRESAPPAWIAEEHRAAALEAVAAMSIRPDDPPVVHFCGDDAQGQEDAAAVAALGRGWRLFTIEAEELPPIGADLNLLLALWERESRLLTAALLVRCASGSPTPALRHLAERVGAPFFMASREPLQLNRALVRFDLDKPAPASQKRLWQRVLGPKSEQLNGALNKLSEQFRFSARTIFTSGALASAGAAPPDAAKLWEICRSFARPRLEELAERIVPAAGWSDLILPEAQTRVLRNLVAQVEQRLKVYEDWGFSKKSRRGLGVSALFAGDSGTGKTMAAEVIAGALALDLYRIDLSAVVSKYIGETEKNLKHVFDAAEEGGALLLFDEADALFGKRSEVKDSHDRYANIEVGYLLQRMEAYRGLAILTTNLKSALDKAFRRRLRFSVDFPFPNSVQREAIWRGMFPASTPTEALNFSRLAQLNMTGGNIRNIAVNAAFLAAAAQKPVAMAHLLEAARLEAEKVERPLADVEIRGWV
jgi:predicted nucleic acid-binding protein